MSIHEQGPIRLGIAGLGRSGWDIHASACAELRELFTVAAVMDPDPARRAEAVAKFGCRAHDSFSALAKDENVEVVVVATPNFLHSEHTVEALVAGKHVMCEKPFGQNEAEATRMIDAARKAGKTVAPFQNRRYEPHFLKVREIVQSGILGEIQFIRLACHFFRRRWDWQTLTEFGGGELRNTGAHLLDQAMQFFAEDDPAVSVDLRNVLSSGDAEDFFKITLRAPGSPLLEVEMSNTCACPQDRWLVMGDAGGLRGSTVHLEWKWLDWSGYPRIEADRRPPQAREYPGEKLAWQTESWVGSDDFATLATDFYRDYYASVREGKPLVVTPESVRRHIALVESCRRAGGVKQGRFSMLNAAVGAQ